MAIAQINVGANPDDGSGDKLRVGGQLLNTLITQSNDIKTQQDLNTPAIALNTASRLQVSDSVIHVKVASDFGVIDSTKVYVVDGIVDMGTTSVEVPATGINILGYTFDVSQLISTANNYTMFTSPVGGSGNVLGMDVGFTTSGTNSMVFDLVSDTGFEAFEFSRVNFNDCTSLGVIDSYRQGLETGTGRFGGTPTLELKGTWIGGYFIETSIVRNLDPAMNAPLYKAGAGFTMASRFRSNQNIDLGATASFFDFDSSHFTSPSTVQITGALVSRNGVFDANDATIIPNMDRGDLEASWLNNVGLMNTFVGGRLDITAEAVTTINTQSVFEPLAGTWTPSDLQHFSEPAEGQLKHLGTSPIDFKITADIHIVGTNGNELTLRAMRWNDADSVFVEVGRQSRPINNLQGGRDLAFFTGLFNVTLSQNDYVFLEVANDSGTADVTLELNSFCVLEER